MMKKIALAVSVLVVFLFLWGTDTHQNRTVMNAAVCQEQELQKLLESRTVFPADVVTELKINDVSVPFEYGEERYYIAKNTNEDDWKGTLSAYADGVPIQVAWVEDEAFEDIPAAVADGHVFQCVIYSQTEYRMALVLLTGLPVMSIHGSMGEQGTRISIFDPIHSINGGYYACEALAYYNIRGNASRRFEKLGYRLEFFQEDGSTALDLSLLGMRTDNDWQLKAMYSDRSKLRDKLSIELWNNIADMSSTQADAGCRMEYLELIINGEYRGLYGLVEPTDYKSLGLDKTKDIIYKAGADEWPDDSLFDASEDEQSFSCAGIKIRQAGKAYTMGIWEPFRAFWNHGYEMTSEDDLEELYGCIDRQNFIDYDLYYNVIAGMDNRFKNIIYSTQIEHDGTWTIRRIPWDQNYSWGDDFASGESKDIKNIRYNPELATRWLNEEVFRNMQQYDKKLPADMLKTWKSWRETFLKEEYWKEYAKEQMFSLTSSGAFARDTERWPESGNVESTEEIEEFIDTRFQWLDHYLQDLAE